MTTFLPAVGYDSVANVHRPLSLLSGLEAVDPKHVPISKNPGNNLVSTPDGLYLGDHNRLPASIIVDSNYATDSPPTSLTAEHTVRSLDYALFLVELNRPAVQFIYVKSGQSQTLTSPHIIRNCDLTIGFYAEPTYSRQDSMAGTGNMYGQYDAAMVRPTIDGAVVMVNTGVWSLFGAIWLQNSKLKLKGLKLNIPSSPAVAGLQPSAYSQAADLIRAFNSEVHLDGVIVNKLSADSCFGLLGVESRSRSLLSAYAVVLTVNNVKLNSSSDTVALLHRQYFIKLLPDYPAANQRYFHYSLVPTALGSSESSAFLDIAWGLTSAVADVVPGRMSLGTFPDGSVDYGLLNYIYGLTRDSQRRPLNVRSNLPL